MPVQRGIQRADAIRDEEVKRFARTQAREGRVSTAVHPAHDELVQTIRDWFHLPFEGMGYCAEKRRWGTYWSNRRVHVDPFPPDQAEAFVAHVRDYYEDRPVFIMVDDQTLNQKLGPALQEAGCAQSRIEIFLAHVGPVPRPRRVPDLNAEPVEESNVRAFVETKLQAFGNGEEMVSEAKTSAEVAQRLAELKGTAKGVLARVEEEPAGIVWWYEEDRDLWIVLLGTRARFRNRGIASWLLSRCLQRGYGRGFRSVVLNVMTDNTRAVRLYRRLGFRDQIYWRQRYLIEGQ